MTLKSIIEHIKQVCRETDITPDDNTILEVAEKILISNQISESKRENIKSMKEDRQILNPSKINEPGASKHEFQRILKATDKQVAYLMKLGYIGDIQDLSKSDAMKLISKLKEDKHGPEKRQQKQS